ncbi:Sentrin-specific protease 2 [Pseudocercospora fuligena]|uniref:Sentrin-specific protease 2 n=1 Tax=Pseudocercospora fuligena TaxID=685502 RepID=A0A8H6VS11_9PEZI|nr:Sentrin-specific protease 2 [Pseudocercospora fuligena]
MNPLLKKREKKGRVGQLYSETYHGYNANGPLISPELHTYRKHLWHSPVDYCDPEQYDVIGKSVFDTRRNGKRTYEAYLPTAPMDIDSEPVHTTEPAGENPDVSMDWETTEAPRVHFSPLRRDPKPRSAHLGPAPTKMGKSALVKRIQAYDSIVDQYVPQTPHKWNPDVDFSIPSGLAEEKKPQLSQPPASSSPFLSSPLKSAPAAPERNNHFEVPEFSTFMSDEFSEFSPEKASTPAAVRAFWTSPKARSPPKRKELSPEAQSSPFQSQFTSPPERKKLSPVSRRSPFQSQAPKPEVLYPGLQNSINEKQYILAEETVYEESDSIPEPIRRIGGMLVGVVTTTVTTYIPAIIGAVWRSIWRNSTATSTPRASREPQEIFAVETAPNSGKRRAVAKQDLMPRPPPEAGAIESQKTGKTPPQMATPPDSRPNSRDEESKKDAARPSRRPQGMLPAPGHTALDYFASTVGYIPRPATASTYVPKGPSKIELVAREARKAMMERQREEFKELKKKRDEDINNLIAKAKQVAIETPEQKRLRQSVSTRKSRAEAAAAEKIRKEEELRQAEEEAGLQAEKEERERIEEELRKKEEEKARLAAQLAAEEEERRLREEAALRAAEVADRPLIPTLSDELEAKIATTMAITDASKIVCKTSAGVELTRYDLGRVLPQPNEKSLRNIPRGSKGGPGLWLNDESVNGFISAIVQRKLDQVGYSKRADVVPAYVAYDTNWYPTYRQKGINGIGRWSRRKHIAGGRLLQCEKIFFPCSTGAHWTLLIISPKARTIEFLDSAHGSRSNWLKIAREWLAMELGGSYKAEEWKEGSGKSQSQLNLDDCGVFTCINALASAEGRDFSEVTAERDMPLARKFIVGVLVNEGFEEA